MAQVSAQLAEPGADTDALMAKMDRLQTAIDACNGWELDRQVQRATEALRCPPGQAPAPLTGTPEPALHADHHMGLLWKAHLQRGDLLTYMHHRTRPRCEQSLASAGVTVRRAGSS
jgi:hypothetical protein